MYAIKTRSGGVYLRMQSMNGAAQRAAQHSSGVALPSRATVR